MEHRSSEPPPNYKQSDGQDPGSSCIPIDQPMKDLVISLHAPGMERGGDGEVGSSLPAFSILQRFLYMKVEDIDRLALWGAGSRGWSKDVRNQRLPRRRRTSSRKA
jgi:hypothetical protein